MTSGRRYKHYSAQKFISCQPQKAGDHGKKKVVANKSIGKKPDQAAANKRNASGRLSRASSFA